VNRGCIKRFCAVKYPQKADTLLKCFFAETRDFRNFL